MIYKEIIETLACYFMPYKLESVTIKSEHAKHSISHIYVLDYHLLVQEYKDMFRDDYRIFVNNERTGKRTIIEDGFELFLFYFELLDI